MSANLAYSGEGCPDTYADCGGLSTNSRQGQCAMFFLSGYATNSPAAVTGNGGISANELIVPDKATVISRLEKVGYSKEEAIARVDKMTDDEIVYFAGHPESIKRSGFIIIASLIGSSVYSSVQSGQKKKLAEIQKKRDQIAFDENDIRRKQNEQETDARLLEKEQDSGKIQELKAAINNLGNEIKSLESDINLLENQVKDATSPKKK